MPAEDPAPIADDIDAWPAPVEVLNEDGRSPFVLLCEHASNHIPPRYAGLGLAGEDLTRHIAWDIGAAAVTRALVARLDAPAFLGTASRLLLDLNRPSDSPTFIPARSEATDIPGNHDLDATERQARIDALHTPYHARVAAHLDARAAAGRPTRIVTIHSFTPVFHGAGRPWHAGVLFAAARDFATAIMAGLARDPVLVIGENEPYGIDRGEDYAIPVHGDDRGLPACLIEIRQDLLSDKDGIADWANRLAAVLVSIPT